MPVLAVMGDSHAALFGHAGWRAGAPWWDPEATGLLTGLTLGTSLENIARAALESIAFQITDLLDQFPFRENSVEAAREGIATMRNIHRALDRLDVSALRQAQDRQDALAAGKIARQGLLGSQRDY